MPEKKRKEKPQKNRGIENELRVVASLSILKRINPLVYKCHHSRKDGENDEIGIDVSVLLRNGFAFLIQVKSCRKKLKRQFEKHPHIAVVIINDKMSGDQIAGLLNQLINNFGKDFFQKIVDEDDVYPKYEVAPVAAA